MKKERRMIKKLSFSKTVLVDLTRTSMNNVWGGSGNCLASATTKGEEDDTTPKPSRENVACLGGTLR